MIRTCKKNVKVGNGYVFVVLEAHVRLLTSINDLPLYCKLYININLVKMKFVSVFV